MSELTAEQGWRLLSTDELAAKLLKAYRHNADLQAQVERLTQERDEARRQGEHLFRRGAFFAVMEAQYRTLSSRLETERDEANRQLAETAERGVWLWDKVEETAMAVVQRTIDMLSAGVTAKDRQLAAVVEGLDQWIRAYGPNLIVYPSKEEVLAVNETPEFRIGRNATMQVVSEGLQKIVADIPAAGAKLERAEKLAPYVQHLSVCRIAMEVVSEAGYNDQVVCTCGLTALREEGK